MKMWDIATSNQGGWGLASFVGTMNRLSEVIYGRHHFYITWCPTFTWHCGPGHRWFFSWKFLRSILILKENVWYITFHKNSYENTCEYLTHSCVKSCSLLKLNMSIYNKNQQLIAKWGNNMFNTFVTLSKFFKNYQTRGPWATSLTWENSSNQ